MVLAFEMKKPIYHPNWSVSVENNHLHGRSIRGLRHETIMVLKIIKTVPNKTETKRTSIVTPVKVRGDMFARSRQ